MEHPMISIEVKISAETPEELIGVIGGLAGESEAREESQDALLILIEELDRMGRY